MEVQTLLVVLFFLSIFSFHFFLVLIQPQEGREIGGKLEEGGEMRSNERRMKRLYKIETVSKETRKYSEIKRYGVKL